MQNFITLFALCALTAQSALAGSLTGVKYTTVGGTGSYQQITNMQCNQIGSAWKGQCSNKTVNISGKLAPCIFSSLFDKVNFG